MLCAHCIIVIVDKAAVCFLCRTIITVVELLAAVCLVRGGHAKVIEAVDNFKRENKEQHRFENLVKRFMEHQQVSTEFQLACMNFINVIVHSAEDINFRVHLQYEFTELGLDEYLEVRVSFVCDKNHTHLSFTCASCHVID